ncbi:MAG TPA: NADH-quinone oxidoreductase subunit J [Candidatus Thermoplasmatota archaeon]|nr:NADH-quinone oxidoreductase subunit J [Candidatus Thermoplasmatota archaeon]
MKADTKADVKLVTALLVLALLALSAILSPAWREAPIGDESLPGVTAAIFTDYLVAFEVLSVLLLAALVGAVVIAIREKEVL